MRNALVLVQHRNDEKNAYNDFIGKFYHFPGNQSKSYLSQFDNLPLEFVYYEPKSNGGKGEYFAYGTISKKPFEDKREPGFYFVEIDDFKKFKKPVSYKDASDELIEKDSPHYNAQNAVRKIDPSLLDEICLDGEIQLNFKADAHLIKVLGEQLIASEKVGILELIKNAYDAHARDCTVRIENLPNLLSAPKEDNIFPDLPGPVIVIEDNGVGMSRDVLERGWLRPASTIKTNIKEKFKEERKKALLSGTLGAYDSLVNEIKKANHNRIPLGEKGVGRFATHRLGRKLIITTKTQDLDYEYVLEIDWDAFDKYSDVGIDLHLVGITLKRQPPSRDYGSNNSGTRIVIYTGREGFEWNVDKIKDLNLSILRLNSPNPNPVSTPHNFRATLVVPQLPELDTTLENKFDPIFELFGLVDDEGNFDYELNFNPPEKMPIPISPEKKQGVINLKDSNKNYWRVKPEKTECGPFYIHLKLWYRVEPWVKGADKDTFLKYLSDYGGISIYRDGINVFPAEWGAENDWLDLSKKHISKGSNFSYYNMLGNIEIDQTSNLSLIDKTNREGLIENPAYKELITLTQTILEIILLNEWTGKRDKYFSLSKDIARDPKTIEAFTKQASSVAEKIIANYPIEKDEYKILQSLGDNPREKLVNLQRSLTNLQKSLMLMQESQDLLTEQAAYGLAVAVSVHEIAKITSNFYHGINELLKKDKYDREKLVQLQQSSSSLSVELNRIGPLRAVKNEARKVFKISGPIEYALDMYSSRFKELNISVSINLDNDFEIYARYAVMIQIFTNLIDNAVYWVNSKDIKDRKIEIRLDKEFRTIVFADSGPGIHETMMPYLFKPGYSLKLPASGLGLHICEYYLHDIKADIYHLSNDKYRLPDLNGAQFLLDFSKVPNEMVKKK